jgi:hypothetical protein
MLAAIDQYDAASTALAELTSSLVPSRDVEIEASRRACLSALTEKQRGVLLKFIEWAAREHPYDVDEDDRATIVSANARGTGSCDVLDGG